MAWDAVELLKELVQIDSRNTTSLRSGAEPAVTEGPICDFVRGLLVNLGFDCAVQFAAPHRPNLIARSGRDAKRPWFAFEAHLDTVGVDGMSIDPFSARIRDGRLYGRGAADTKGSMAAMLAALSRLVRDDHAPNLIFIGACAEETGCEGIARLELDGPPIDAVVAGEPTSNRLVTAHKAHAWFQLLCRGRAAHGARPEAGENAIYRMTDAIAWLRRTVAPRLAAQTGGGLQGSTLSVNVIEGGRRLNMVPDECRAAVDVRLVPGHPPREFVQALTEEARQTLGHNVECSWLHVSPGLETDASSPLVRAFQTALNRRGMASAPEAVSYCTDAGVLAARGTDAVVFGPGSILQAHAAEEFVELEQVETAADILEDAALAYNAART
ncbi:MAG: M20 family metallopeptidase [Kiritimatiellaeota bacterium]|nr:M20 family metallopeptidase [Kiritimatiellota bacterium]